MSMRPIVLMLLTTLLLAGCGATLQATQSPAPGDTNPAAQKGTVVTTVDGETVHIGAGKPTALFFMAAWCTTCLGEAQAWQELIEAGKTEGVSVLAVDVDPSDTREGLQQFRSALTRDPLLWAMDAQGELAKRYHVARLDTTVVLDGAGKEVYRDQVVSTVEQLQAALKAVEATR